MHNSPLIRSSHMWLEIPPSVVETSAGRAFWFKSAEGYITLNGNKISSWNDAFGIVSPISQATSANQPLFHTYESPTSGKEVQTLGNYIYFPGNAGSGEYVSTPDSAQISITGDIDIRAQLAMDNWSGAGVIASKYGSAGQRSWSWSINAGVMTITWSEDGTTLRAANATTAVSYTGSDLGLLRVTVEMANAGTGFYKVRFYTSSDGGDTWNLLGADIDGIVASSIFDSTAPLEIGSRTLGTAENIAAKIYNVNLRNGIAGPLVARFNPDQGSIYSNTFVAASGETYTITNNTALATIYHVQMVDRTLAQFDGSNDLLKVAGGFTLNQPATVYLLGKFYSFTGTDCFFDGNANNSMSLQQSAASPNVRLNAGVNGPDNGGWPLNTWRIITCVFNGANSYIRVDNTGTAVSGSAGATNAGGFTLGARADGVRAGNICIREIVGYNLAHDTTRQLAIIQDIAARNRYTLT